MARSKARYEILPKTSESKAWYVGFYIQLSHEDFRGNGESRSVHNQWLILIDWFSNQFDNNKYVLMDESIDDGISGTTDGERLDSQRLLRFIEAGKTNYVAMRNLACSFKNHADQGYYLEGWFIIHQVRFISLHRQPIDTYKDLCGAASIGVLIQGAPNESHARGTPESMYRIFDKKREKRLRTGSFATYGYKENPEGKSALAVDEETAEVVQGIFS